MTDTGAEDHLVRHVDDRTASTERDDNVNVLYIAGIGRSGSTLLCRTLGSVDGFVATGELMRILERGFISGDLCSCGTPEPECRLWRSILADVARRAPGLDFDHLERARKRATESWEFLRYLFLPNNDNDLGRALGDYRAFLTTLYRSVRDVTGARFVVDASKNLLYCRLLSETPGVKLTILHLVRDSRGVAHSLMKKQPRPGTNGRFEHFRQQGPLLGSILWNTAHVTTERLSVRASRVVRVRYEDFVAQPAATVNAVVTELEAGRDRFHPPHITDASVCLGVDHLIASNPNRSNRGEIKLREDVAWRRDMPAFHQWLVSVMTAPLLSRYGYPVLPGRSPSGPGLGGVVSRQPEP